MQLNSPGAINGLLIQTRPGGGAAPSPTGSGALVALPFAVAFFRLDDWPGEEKKREAHEQPRCRYIQYPVETHKHGIVSNRHAKARAAFFRPSIASSTGVVCPIAVPYTPYFGPSHPIPRTTGWRCGDDARAHAASCMALHALGAAHTVDGGAIAQTRSAPALAAPGLLQVRVVPSLFAYLRPGCSIAAASTSNGLFLRVLLLRVLFPFPCTSLLFSSAGLIYIVVPSL